MPKRSSKPAALPKELDTPEFRETWADWIQHRKEINKPMHSVQARRLLKRLAKLGVEVSIEMMDYTMTQGWQGLRMPDGSSGDGETLDLNAMVRRAAENTDDDR